jgi:heme oxygenase
MHQRHRDVEASRAGTMAALRAATWPAHQRLEGVVDVKQRFSSLEGYREHLGKLWGFCAALERQLQPGFFGDALPDYESRRKLPLLARDLTALGADPLALPVCSGMPACTDPTIAFGCLYVLEGSTLGARVLLPIVTRELDLDAAHGAVYLESYGAGTAERWAVFGAALDAWCDTPARRAAATRAAIDSFGVLQDWLTARAEC